MTDQWDFTSRFEGVVPHMYLDTRGLVTAGVGFMLPDVRAAQLLFSSFPPQTVANDFARIRSMSPGKPARVYALACRCTLSKAEMEDGFESRVASIEYSLSTIFPSWSTFPRPAIVALVDMAYNLGVGALRNRWPHLRDALSSHDWARCAVECHRDGVSAERNLATANLFQDAAKDAP
jgi:GH24 family phage-related lysozyme (muramidase)